MEKNKLEILSTQIRNDIPRLMELSENCILEHFIGVKHKLVSKYIYNGKIKYNLVNTENGLVVSISEDDIFEKKYYSIIGHDIMLNDILEWLDKVANKYQFRVESDGKINFDTSLDEDLYWNLSSLYLKDQSEKLIEFLYSLIK